MADSTDPGKSEQQLLFSQAEETPEDTPGKLHEQLNKRQGSAIARRYQAGESVHALASAYGVSGPTIRKVLAARDVTLRTQSEAAQLIQDKNKISDGLTGNQRRLRRQRAAGLCTYCPSPHLPGLTLCAACREKDGELKRCRRKRRLAAGFCSGCNAPSVPNRKFCQTCLDRDKTLRRGRRAQGLCVGCGEPSFGKQCCPACRAQKVESDHRLKAEVFNAYGGCRCACCGETNMALLTLDHIKGDGASHRRSLGKDGIGRSLRRKLREQGYPSGFQVLCWSCNAGKRTGDQCPHEAEYRAMLGRLADIPLTY